MGDNEPFRDVDYTTNPVTVGDFFNCANAGQRLGQATPA